jgi:hypothetical protein
MDPWDPESDDVTAITIYEGGLVKASDILALLPDDGEAEVEAEADADADALEEAEESDEEAEESDEEAEGGPTVFGALKDTFRGFKAVLRTPILRNRERLLDFMKGGGSGPRRIEISLAPLGAKKEERRFLLTDGANVEVVRRGTIVFDRKRDLDPDGDMVGEVRCAKKGVFDTAPISGGFEKSDSSTLCFRDGDFDNILEGNNGVISLQLDEEGAVSESTLEGLDLFPEKFGTRGGIDYTLQDLMRKRIPCATVDEDGEPVYGFLTVAPVEGDSRRFFVSACPLLHGFHGAPIYTSIMLCPGGTLLLMDKHGRLGERIYDVASGNAVDVDSTVAGVAESVEVVQEKGE